MFNKKITPFALVVAMLICCVVTAVCVGSYSSVKYKAELDSYRNATSPYFEYSPLIGLVGAEKAKYEKLAQLISMVDTTYVRDYDKDELWDNVYRSLIVSIGDTYGDYLTADAYNAMIDSGSGNFVGIGIHAQRDPDTYGVYVFGVMPNSPAEQAGMKKGDIIIASEGVIATENNYYDLLDTIRGESGTEVKLTVRRDGEELDLVLVRAAVASENVIYEKLDNIAYIKILSFSNETVSEEFKTKIELAQNEGCESFVFDVRNNTGGYLDEICDVLDLLLPEGPIINIVEANGNTKTENSDEHHTEGKMVVLCNGVTASAAELFTAALRDYELAKIVGMTTFGKGTMQTTRLLSDGSAFKLSTAYYNPPSNVSYDGVGIIPDYEINLDEKWNDKFYQMPNEEDAQLQKAIEILLSTD